MSILQIQTAPPTGQAAVTSQVSMTQSTLPSLIYIQTTDTYAVVTATGYLTGFKQEGFTFSNNQMALVYTTDEGPIWLKVVITYANSSVLSSVISLVAPDIEGGGVPFINTVPEATATPGTVRSITGAISDSISVMTSGNLVGVRGAATVVGASGGFLYGTQGKLLATGTLSGSVWAAGLFGQLDMSAATINAGQVSPIWADFGTTVGTATNMTGTSLFKGTNTTGRVLNSQLWLDGGATNLMQLSGVGNPITYVSSGGAGTLSGTINKLAITIEGVTYYIPCATVIS